MSQLPNAVASSVTGRVDRRNATCGGWQEGQVSLPQQQGELAADLPCPSFPNPVPLFQPIFNSIAIPLLVASSSSLPFVLPSVMSPPSFATYASRSYGSFNSCSDSSSSDEGVGDLSLSLLAELLYAKDCRAGGVGWREGCQSGVRGCAVGVVAIQAYCAVLCSELWSKQRVAPRSLRLLAEARGAAGVACRREVGRVPRLTSLPSLSRSGPTTQPQLSKFTFPRSRVGDRSLLRSPFSGWSDRPSGLMTAAYPSSARSRMAHSTTVGYPRQQRN